MKAFNLEEAINGALICLNEEKGKYVLLNRNEVDGNVYIFQFQNEQGSQSIMSYHENKNEWFYGINHGVFNGNVFMAPVKKEVWVNLYNNNGEFVTDDYTTFASLREAEKDGKQSDMYVKSVKIHEYEE